MALQPFVRRVALLGVPVLMSALAAACGGDGGGSDTGPVTGTNDVDPNRYSVAGNGSLSTPNESTSVTHGTVAVGGTPITYTATAGHLTAKDSSGADEASFFYVSYTKDVAAGSAPRPVTFFFNGGPGSASAYLHLGSWAPKRLSTGVPATTQAAPFPYVDNAESLIDTSDLVFVDAIGTGLSEAISPHTNQDYWGVDADGAVFRDFIERWLDANSRAASKLFIYGESYGTVRAPVLTRLLETAGFPVAGVILQSSIVNYNSNCSIDLPSAPTVTCAGALPTYAAVGAYFDLAVPAPSDLTTFLQQMRTYADGTYEPQTLQWLDDGGPSTPPPGGDVSGLVARTGLGASFWDARYDMDYDTFRHNLIANTVLGVYDGRMSATNGSALAKDDDPSNTFIAQPFSDAMNQTILPTVLGFTTPSTYVLTSDAINTWNFSHGGQSLPDVIPDLAAAISLDASLKILSIGGEHDLITPFHQTELDLTRLASGAPVTNHFYPGGHMTYLTDATRPLMKADLVTFYASATGGQ
jgi:carboxypeptidase C (cathepsin A)